MYYSVPNSRVSQHGKYTTFGTSEHNVTVPLIVSHTTTLYFCGSHNYIEAGLG